MRTRNHLSLLATAIACASLTAAASGQNLYVTDSLTDQIETFDSSGHSTTFATTGLSTPVGIALDPSGNVYVSNYTGKITKFSSNGTLMPFYQSGVVDTARTMAFDKFGNLYVANLFDNSITKFDQTGHGTQFNVSGVTLNQPTGLAFDSAGTLFVSNQNGNTISKFDTAGNGTAFTITGVNLSEPTGLAFDSQGNLYVANYGGAGNEIDKIATNGVGVKFNLSGSINGPVGLAFDAMGNLFAASFNDNKIEEYNSQGAGTTFATGGNLQHPWGLAFGAAPASVTNTPEPGACTLLLGLAGTAVFAVKRRTRSRRTVAVN